MATHTLEHDLFEQSERNKAIMRDVYRKIHAQTDDLSGDFNVSTLMKNSNLIKIKRNLHYNFVID